MNETPTLVAGRECGECAACCKVPEIDELLLRKPAEILCPNSTSHGCKIYDSRPAPCRAFYCNWRMDSQLHDDWRPDRSGVLIKAMEIGTDLNKINALQMIIFADHAVVFDPGFATFVAIWIERGVEVVLTITSGPGKLAREVRLSGFVGVAVAQGDLADVMACIKNAYAAIVALPVL